MTIGLPTTWVVALSQIGSTPVRGLLLVVGTLGLAWVIERPDDTTPERPSARPASAHDPPR